MVVTLTAPLSSELVIFPSILSIKIKLSDYQINQFQLVIFNKKYVGIKF